MVMSGNGNNTGTVLPQQEHSMLVLRGISSTVGWDCVLGEQNWILERGEAEHTKFSQKLTEINSVLIYTYTPN